jgi:2'-hydroxyisoflavone reductase
MLAPGTSESPIQFIDARDLAAFTIHVAESKKTGTFHCAGPSESWTWKRLFEECGRVNGR